jgi:hypothetical protein
MWYHRTIHSTQIPFSLSERIVFVIKVLVLAELCCDVPRFAFNSDSLKSSRCDRSVYQCRAIAQNNQVRYVRVLFCEQRCSASNVGSLSVLAVPDTIVIRTEAVIAKTVLRYCLGKPKIAEDKLLPLPIYPLKFACWLTWDRTWLWSVNDRRRAAWTRHDTTHTTRHVTTRHDTSRHDTTRHDTSRHDTSRHDTTRHVTTRHDTSRHDTTHTTRHVTTRHDPSSLTPIEKWSKLHPIRGHEELEGK